MKRFVGLFFLVTGCTAPELELSLPDVPDGVDGAMVVAILSESQSTVCGGPAGFSLQFEHSSEAPHSVAALYYEYPSPRLPIEGIDRCPIPIVSDESGTPLPEPTQIFETRFENGQYTGWSNIDDTTGLTRPLPQFREREAGCPRFLAQEPFDVRTLDPEANVTMLLRGPENRVLFATDQGQFGYLINGQMEQLGRPRDASTHYTAAHLAPSMTLWMGRVDGAILAVDPNTLDVETQIPGRPADPKECNSSNDKTCNQVVDLTSDPNTGHVYAISKDSRIARYSGDADGWQDIASADGLLSRRRSLAVFEGEIFDTADHRCTACDNLGPPLRVHSLTETSTRAQFRSVDNGDLLFRIRVIEDQLYALGQDKDSLRHFYKRIGPDNWSPTLLRYHLAAYFDMVPFAGGLVIGGASGHKVYHDLVFNQACPFESPLFVADLDWMVLIEDTLWSSAIDSPIIFATKIIW